ncbi:uncharacterized peroxidase-related enzyme [Actinokineospora alba]|uniref:Uncharacterized peroxidase-related enzyme n=1 Tax=Actinokineospora alba TaxID=504798 RepID=A0A1H0QYT4_9PSEU|nr:carboxymuconolactone decarboxylase family protein [Actinokineospora alba]TDP70327.1 putative peroxidase-related enzyme [Actinokineospora alba]SDI34037.1 uncharacterized peroxidase-related enzyme [Actinokineospora alba]SDP22473.1 uncharacterized peroxidase-related enzyme [Actinokineospora alba]
MRLDVLEHGHRLPARLFQRIAALVSGEELDDVGKTALHRPEFFGKPFLAYVAEVLRGPSYWTPAEREYLAMVTSAANECPFCRRVHTEVARLVSTGEVDVDTAAVRPELAATATFLERLTRTPDDVTAADLAPLRAAGVPDQAVVDALHVNAVFNLVNRLANAFEWSWDSDAHVLAGAKALKRFRYRLPGIFMR